MKYNMMQPFYVYCTINSVCMLSLDRKHVKRTLKFTSSINELKNPMFEEPKFDGLLIVFISGRQNVLAKP
jgi:hypothetical protein